MFSFQRDKKKNNNSCFTHRENADNDINITQTDHLFIFNHFMCAFFSVIFTNFFIFLLFSLSFLLGLLNSQRIYSNNNFILFKRTGKKKNVVIYRILFTFLFVSIHSLIQSCCCCCFFALSIHNHYSS